MNLLRCFAVVGLLLSGVRAALADTTFTYTLSGTQATITGFAATATTSGALTIPATVDGYTVVAVGRGAFRNNPGITSLDFASGSSVAALGPQAFQGCTGLTTVSLPSALTAVPAGAFLGCTSLATVGLPSNLTAIEAAAFADCAKLASITLPTGLTTLGASAFQGCTTLSAVALPSGVATLSAHAFDGCRALASLTLSSGLVTIGDYALANADKLTAIALPATVTSVGAGAFRDCDALSSLSLGAAVATLGDGFVAGCEALANFSVDPANTTFASTSGVLFNAARTTLLLAPPALAGSYTVPSTVTALAADAFAHCRRLTGIGLPAMFTEIPAGAFYYSGLTTLSLPDTIATIGAWAFGGCSGLEAVVLPAGVATLGADAFHYATGLTKATFAGNAPATGDDCFDNTASSFTVYYIPAATGFTTPTWLGYPSVCVDSSTVVDVPAVTTAATTAGRTSAAITGLVSSANGSAVTARGFVYAQASGPTLASGTTLTVGSGLGYFTGTLDALTVSTTYYVRAYATNATGTAYGDELSFTTGAALSAPTVTSPVTTGGTTPTLTGTAEAGATVRVTVDGNVVGTTTVDSSGAWSYTLSTLATGAHAIVVTVIDAAGNTSSTSFTQTIISTSFTAPVPDGYAAAATGGAAGTTVVAATAADFTTYATAATPYVITVAGTLDIGTVAVASNKTIQGADAAAALDGCLNLSGVSNVIIRGLNLANPDGHALQLANATTVFVTHCTFLDCAGNQVTAASSNLLTVSWCEFAATVAGQAAVQLGTSSETTTPKVTLHHNWWSTGLGTALPAAAAGSIHQYSDYLVPAGNTTGTALTGAAQLLTEGNLYSGVANPLTKAGAATAYANNNVYAACTGTTATATDTVFVPPYSYELLAPADLATAVTTLAGNTAGAGSSDLSAATASINAPATTVASGSSCTLTAAISGVTATSYQWRQANVPLTGATSSTYTISSMSSSTAGTYTVAIGLADGSTVVSTPVTLTVSASTNTDGGSSSGGSSSSGGGGGGGAPSIAYLALLGVLAALRIHRRR